MAETLAGHSLCQEVVAIRALFSELGFPQLEATMLSGDNETMISQAVNPINHDGSGGTWKLTVRGNCERRQRFGCSHQGPGTGTLLEAYDENYGEQSILRC